ncbi:transposase [Kitasatospora sp. NPDC059673]|uniref:transposase n=1 Tax=Kitasatospora sp. NPDC059673 TaxID=3346901 RepID=UPI00367777B8
MLLRWRAARAEGREPTTELREVANAILHAARTGIAWRYLPHDFPPHTTATSRSGSATAPPSRSTTPSATSRGRRRAAAPCRPRQSPTPSP